MRLLGISVVMAVAWAFGWGLCGLAIAVMGTIISPDTGHVAHGMVAFILASVSVVVGFVAGAVYAILSRTWLIRWKRAGVGATIGAAGIITLFSIGAISNSSSANPLGKNFGEAAVSIVIYGPIAAGLGGLLAALDSKLWPIPRQ